MEPEKPPQLAALMQRLMGLVNQRGAGDSLRLMHETGLTFPQVIALYVLDGLGPQTVSSMAENTRLSMGATSQLVDRLVGAGLVTRDEADDDRRVRVVTLGPRGKSLLDRLHGIRRREWQTALGRLPPELHGRLVAVMSEVVEALQAAEGPSSREGGQPQTTGRRTPPPKAARG